MGISRGLCAVAAIFLAVAAQPAAAESIGEIKELKGSGSIGRDGALRPMEIGSEIELNDALRTASDGAVGISLADGTVMSLGPDAHLVVDEFIYDPGAENVGLGFSFMAGSLQYISGRIAQIDPARVHATTPMGTIGIRGTRFLIKVEGE